MLDVSDLLASLSSANVTISTQQNSSGQTAPAGGDITVSTAIDIVAIITTLPWLPGDISIFFPITMGASGDLTYRLAKEVISTLSRLATAALTANDLVVKADMENNYQFSC